MDIVERLTLICNEPDAKSMVNMKASLTRHDLAQAASEITRLREENKVMREALDPFAREAAFWPDGNRDGTDIGPRHRINVGHLRRASAALATTGGE